jgi:hypothetical protein
VTDFYTDMATTTKYMLTEFGMDVTLKRVDDGVYDPATGSNSQSYPTEFTRKGALFDFGSGQVNGPGGLIQGGDKRLLLEPGVAPALEDRIVADGIEYVIKGILEINPAGTSVMFDLHLRT